jgi:hypothetical protein
VGIAAKSTKLRSLSSGRSPPITPIWSSQNEEAKLGRSRNVS